MTPGTAGPGAPPLGASVRPSPQAPKVPCPMAESQTSCPGLCAPYGPFLLLSPSFYLLLVQGPQHFVSQLLGWDFLCPVDIWPKAGGLVEMSGQQGSQRRLCPPFWATSVCHLRAKLLGAPGTDGPLSLTALGYSGSKCHPLTLQKAGERIGENLSSCALQPGLWWLMPMTPAREGHVVVTMK